MLRAGVNTAFTVKGEQRVRRRADARTSLKSCARDAGAGAIGDHGKAEFCAALRGGQAGTAVDGRHA